MATDLAISRTFEGKEIRAVEHDGQVWIPLVDLTKAWGIKNRKTLGNITIRNKKVFEGRTWVGLITYPNQKQPDSRNLNNSLKYVNEQGLYALMEKVSPERLKNPESKEIILRFQRWVPELLTSLRKGEPTPPLVPERQLPKQLGDLVSQHLQIADAICVYAHVDRGIATSIALSRVEYETGVDLSAYKNLLPKARQQPFANLTPTQIGKELGLTPITVNKILEKLGYQYYMGNDWHPTHVGTAYSEAFPVTGIAESGKSYSRYQLKWAPRIIELLREHLFGVDEMKKKGEITGYIG